MPRSQGRFRLPGACGAVVGALHIQQLRLMLVLIAQDQVTRAATGSGFDQCDHRASGRHGRADVLPCSFSHLLRSPTAGPDVLGYFGIHSTGRRSSGRTLEKRLR